MAKAATLTREQLVAMLKSDPTLMSEITGGAAPAPAAPATARPFVDVDANGRPLEACIAQSDASGAVLIYLASRGQKNPVILASDVQTEFLRLVENGSLASALMKPAALPLKHVESPAEYQARTGRAPRSR